MNFDIEEIWNDVQGHLAKQMKGPSFQTWIKPSKLIEINGNKAIIAVKNEFNKNFLKQAYIHKIAASIEKVLNRKIEVEILVKRDLVLGEFISSIANLQENESIPLNTPIINHQPSSNGVFFDHTFRLRSNLNPSYSFESFVVGQNNQFSHAAALAVAEACSEQYNPLFIYGGVGLGKTHLAHAIANYKLSQNPQANIKYLSSESFTNELIQSIRTDSMNKFREKYRQVDLLMIDDIQFLAGKEATQEEFFHTFNALKENGKQIILTSDRPPSSLSSIADRLRNRFEGGLIADIQIPDIETRIAILMLKAMILEIDLSIEVAEYICTIYQNNIRELEGALKRVHAYLSFTQEEINLRNVQKVLSQGKENEKSSISPTDILKTVASYYNVSFNDLAGLKRSNDLTSPRHIAIYILHEFYNISFPRIGELLSNRTHSSAIYAHKQVKIKMAKDKDFSEEVNRLRGLLERKKVN